MRFLLGLLLFCSFAVAAPININSTLCEGNDLFVEVDVNENTTICTYNFHTPGGGQFFFHDYDCNNYTITWNQLTDWTSAPLGEWRASLVHQLGSKITEVNDTFTVKEPFNEQGTLSMPDVVKSGEIIIMNATWVEMCTPLDDFRFYVDGAGQQIVLYEGKANSRNVTKTFNFSAPDSAGRYSYAFKYWRGLTGKGKTLDTETVTVVGVNILFKGIDVYSAENMAVLKLANLGSQAATIINLNLEINSTFASLNRRQLFERTLAPGETNLTFTWDDNFPLIGLLPGTLYKGALQMIYKDTYTDESTFLNKTFTGTVQHLCGNFICEYTECAVCPSDCKKEECLGDDICHLDFGETCLNDCPCLEDICDPSHPRADKYGCAPDEVDIVIEVYSNNTRLQDALVKVANSTCTTDFKGKCSFTLLRGQYQYAVEKEGYLNQSGLLLTSKKVDLPKLEIEEEFDPTGYFFRNTGTLALLLPLLPLIAIIAIFFMKKLKG